MVSWAVAGEALGEFAGDRSDVPEACSGQAGPVDADFETGDKFLDEGLAVFH